MSDEHDRKIADGSDEAAAAIDALFDFPCAFPIKAMGKSGAELEAAVMEIIHRHVSDLGEAAVKMNTSKGGKFTSITITITARSRAHLDGIYLELSACEHVLYAL
jgi:putative lipoic acid-binding regulatory protein